MTGTIRPSSPSETAIPRCTASWTAYASPSSVAFTDANSRSASIVQRATIGSAVMARRARAAWPPDMSASIHVVHVAATSSERFMCSPIWRRMRERPPVVPTGAAGGAGGGGGGAGVWGGRGRRLGLVGRLDVQRRLFGAVAHERQHVLLAHAPAAARALDALEVDPV